MEFVGVALNPKLGVAEATSDPFAERNPEPLFEEAFAIHCLCDAIDCTLLGED